MILNLLYNNHRHDRSDADDDDDVNDESKVTEMKAVLWSKRNGMSDL